MAAPFSSVRSFSGPGVDDFIQRIASDLDQREASLGIKSDYPSI